MKQNGVNFLGDAMERVNEFLMLTVGAHSFTQPAFGFDLDALAPVILTEIDTAEHIIQGTITFDRFMGLVPLFDHALVESKTGALLGVGWDDGAQIMIPIQPEQLDKIQILKVTRAQCDPRWEQLWRNHDKFEAR